MMMSWATGLRDMMAPRWVKCAVDQPRTFEILEDGKAIRFQPCGVTSYHPEDVSHRYCAYCHRFIEPVAK